LFGWAGEDLTSPHRKEPGFYEMLGRASELAGPCEHGKEFLSSIKCGEFID